MATVKLGTLIKPAKLQKCGENDYPVLSMTMHDGLVFQSDKFKKSVASQDKSTYKIVYRNQLVIGFPIDEGVLATQRITDAGIVSPAYGIWDVVQTKIIPEFLEYALRSERAIDYYKAKLRSSTARRRSLPTPTLLELDIPLPDIEQQKIALTIIRNVKNAMDNRRKQLSKLDELVKAHFIEMFGDPVRNPMNWKRVRFDSICENLDSRRVPITESDRKKGVYPYYGASGIVDWVDDYIFDENVLLVSEDGANLLMRSTPIAFSISGKTWVNNHAHVVRFQDFATQKFIETYFSMIDVSEYITGTAQPKLNQAKLNAMEFCLPPLSLQNQFAAFVEEVDKQKQTVQQSLDKLELLKKALMQEYFG